MSARLPSIDLGIPRKLRGDRVYRQRFFLAESSALIAKQLIELRKRRGLNQSQVAEELETAQPAISRVERADYRNWSFNTLRRLADAMDARLRVIIEPSEDVLSEYEEEGKPNADPKTPDFTWLLNSSPKTIQDNNADVKFGDQIKQQQHRSLLHGYNAAERNKQPLGLLDRHLADLDMTPRRSVGDTTSPFTDRSISVTSSGGSPIQNCDQLAFGMIGGDGVSSLQGNFEK